MSKSSAYINVSCDRENCTTTFDEIELTSLAGKGQWDERVVDRYLERHGWRVEGTKHVCDNCIAEDGDREAE